MGLESTERILSGIGQRRSIPMKHVLACVALLTSAAAFAQPRPSAAPQVAAPQPPGPSRPAWRPTSSNPWVSLPEMSVDRCTADDVGTGPDPKTGTPLRVNVDPKSSEAGNIICPPLQPSTEPKPPR